ncbi:MAG: DUF305 domain-containing protein [Actinomycetota bacterium]|nr:DUF305 domain-containing protein [Actinomycetota bacterium]
MRVRGRLVAGLLTVLLAASGCANEPAVGDNPVLQPGRPGEGNKTLSPEEASTAAPKVEPNDADVTYARTMIGHHLQAVEMSALAPQRALDPKLKGLAARIGDTQQPEIDMMNRWLSEHGKPTVETGHSGHGGHSEHEDMPGMATPEQLTALAAATGADFDRQFLQLMIKHHEGAVTMAGQVQRTGADIRIQEMADNVVAEQSDEITRMRAMLGA